MTTAKGFTHLVIVVLIAVISIAMVGVMGYFRNEYRKLPAITPTTTNTTNTPVASNANIAPTSVGEAAAVHTIFQDAMNQNAYDLTQTLFADQVYFVIQASECCGLITPAEAVAQLDYFQGVNTFNFSQDQQLALSMKTNLTEYAEHTIGVAPTKQVVAYRLDANNRIDNVFLTVSHDLLDLN